MSQDQPKVPQDAKVEATSMPNDKFGHQESKMRLQICQASTILKQSMNNGRRPAAEGVAHRITEESSLQKCCFMGCCTHMSPLNTHIHFTERSTKLHVHISKQMLLETLKLISHFVFISFKRFENVIGPTQCFEG